ncbi:MAG: hypothetical protein NT141_01145 [candidate division WWE3 bacterium]|nr:hypothetical protein [candidate division WWE3 bacterium]
MPNTSRLNHEQCREYLAEFSKSAADFKEWSSGTAKVGVEQVSFGGLAKIKDIAAGYDTSPNGWQQSNELYYSNIKVYRGGICKDVTDPHQFLEMFARPTAFNTAYRPLMEDGLTARSLEKPQLATIEQAAQDFNAALILDYAIAGAHPDLDTFEFGSRRNNRNPVIISTELANEFLKSKTVAGTLQREQEVWLKTKGDVSSAAAEVEEKLVFNAGIKGSYIARLLETHSRGNPAHVWASPMVSTSQNKESALKFTIDGIKPNIDGRNHGEYGVLVTASLPKSGFIICNDIRKVPAFQGDSYSWDLNNDGGEEEVLLNGGLAPNAIQEITALEPDGKIACIIRRMSNNEIVYTENSTGKSEIYVIDETGKLRLKP